MKQIITLLGIFFLIVSCKTRTSIASIHSTGLEIPGTYYKDINLEFNKYEGTWIYNDNNSSLTITFRKIIKEQRGNVFYDYLAGEYKYTKDGVEIINSLDKIDNKSHHLISGFSFIRPKEFPGCLTDCSPTEKRVKAYFSDPNPELEFSNNMAMGIRYVIENDNQKLEINLAYREGVLLTDNKPRKPRVPFGSYTLIKQ